MASGKRIVLTILGFDALAFVCCFLYSLADFSADKVVPVFALRWQLADALLRFFALLPAIQFLGVAVALGSSRGSVDELVRSSILPSVVLSALFSASALVASPSIASRRSAIQAASAIFNESLGESKVRLSSGDLAIARAELSRCLAISRMDARVQELAERLANAELKAGSAGKERQEPELRERIDPLAAKDYYLKALQYAEKRDFFSAHWFASAALKLDPSYTDARRLVATAWEQLASAGGDPADEERAAYYNRKLEGYAQLRSGDPVGAYRIFKALAAGHSTDPDIARYLAESLAATERAAFFKDEADGAFASSPVRDVIIRSADADGSSRVLIAREAALANGALYFRELECLNLSGGTAFSIVRAPYAKLWGGELFLVCVERENPDKGFGPSWDPSPALAPRSVIALALEPALAYRLSLARSSPSSLPFLDAWNAAKESRRYGIDSGPLVGELLARTAIPFALFTASALGALTGARFRKKGEGFTRGLYAMVPLMAAAMVPPFFLASRIDELISTWSAKAVPGLSALGLAAGARAAILFMAILLMAGSKEGKAATDEPRA